MAPPQGEIGDRSWEMALGSAKMVVGRWEIEIHIHKTGDGR
jgi:hypothetical protein